MSVDAPAFPSPAVSAADGAVADVRHCPNCDAPAGGKFCSGCGQRNSSLDLSLHDFAHEAFHEFLHFDGKIFRTLKLLLFSPGALTREFVEGKRARSISPVRVYLLASILFFTLVAAFGQFEKSIVLNERPAPPVSSPSTLDERLESGAAKAARDKKAFADALVHTAPKVMFVLLPVAAAIVMLFYRKRQRFYVPHLYFSIHLHAFMFLLFSLVLLLDATGNRFVRTVDGIFVLAAPAYFVAALKNVYGESWGRTLLKGAAIWILYFAVFTLAFIGVVLAQIATM